MARKKRQPPDPAPNQASLEAMLSQFAQALSQQQDSEPLTPLEQAQDMVEEAYQTGDSSLRVALAQQALSLSPDCADAYLILSRHTPGRKEHLALCEQAVAAGLRIIGADFENMVGHFWGVLETRPYMRARHQFATALWTAGRRDEAVAHLWDMLRLNPNDNQGIRDILAGYLLFLDRDDDLARLLGQYPDDASAAFTYTRALLSFRREGDTIASRRLLKAARKANKHVADYLTARKCPPEVLPGYYSPGDEHEAVLYVGHFLAGWKSTLGAIAWLRNIEKPKAKPRKIQGPSSAVAKRLGSRLPQQGVWQVDFRPGHRWLRIAGEPLRPWVILVTNVAEDLVLGHEVNDEQPSADLVWATLIQTMQHPAAGNAHRPVELEVRAGEMWDALRPFLNEAGITLTVRETLAPIDPIFAALFERMCGPDEPGLVATPNLEPNQLASFHEAAALYFQQAPWKKVGFEAAIKVECPGFTHSPWFAVPLGQSGLTFGLALYQDYETLRRMWAGGAEEPVPSPRLHQASSGAVAVSVTFGDQWTIDVAHLSAIEQNGWQVARADAYPQVIALTGPEPRPVTATELAVLEACLRVVPGFVARHGQDDPAREELAVSLSSGEAKLALSWVIEE